MHDQLQQALERAQRAARRDSNDAEITALRRALDMALAQLGRTWPDNGEEYE